MADTHPWLPDPPDGTSVAGGFDGSENNDWSAIKLETREGYLFTPRYGPDRRPTIWNPAEWPDHRTPRHEVNMAMGELARRFRIVRFYYDPGFRDESSWESEGEAWDTLYGPKVFLPWQMAGNSRVNAVYAASRRFETDLTTFITHDGCPITSTHMGNTRRMAQSADRYTLGKPAKSQKIDAAVTSVLAHEAASDMRAEGWPEESTNYVYTSSTTRIRR